MKTKLTTAFAIVATNFSLLFLHSQPAYANGFIESSTMEKSGGVLLDNADGLTLNHETLSIKLLDSGYEVSVSYHIESSGPYKGKLYFPMICSSDEIEECVDYMSVRVAGEPFAINYNSDNSLSRLLGKRYTDVAWKKLNKHGYANEMVAYDAVNEEEISTHLKTKVISADIASKQNEFQLDISYRVKYLLMTEGTTKSVIYDYSDDVVYYDFTPAALWVKGKVPSLDISLDASKVSSQIINHSRWTLHHNQNIYSTTMRNVSLDTLEPLIIGMDREKLHQYRDIQRTLQYHLQRKGGDFTLTSEDAITSQDGRYDAEQASDNDLHSAWCSSKSVPSITVIIDKAENYACFFEGLALFNGYTKDPKIWRANNRTKKLQLNITGSTSEGKAAAKSMNLILEDGAPNQITAPYSTLRFIPIDLSAPEFGLPNNHIQMDELNGLRIELRTLDVYKGDNYNDTCISEILPVYNCG